VTFMASAELFDDPFEPDEYVERLAWRTPGGGTKGGLSGFSPQLLNDEFVAHIHELKLLDGRLQKKIEKLEAATDREAAGHTSKVLDLHKSNQVAFSHLQSLENRINYVATKVVHLGDQLEGVNTPRTHAAEALKLMRYFDEFLSGNFTSPVFKDEDRTRDAADIVHKLHLIAQELPSSRFQKVKTMIVNKYHEIETKLLKDFKIAHQNNEVEKMKDLASVLSQFKGYQHCTGAFIEESINSRFSMRADVFKETIDLCDKVYPLVMEIFSSPELVMAKLVTQIYTTKLTNHINDGISNAASDREKFLQCLQTFYENTIDLSTSISHFKIGSDSNFLTKLTKGIFKPYLDKYISEEKTFLKEKATKIMQRFYDSKNHTKKQLHTGIQDFKAAITDKTNIRFGLGSNQADVTAGETYLSQELTINLLQETKMAFGRCKTLSSSSALPENATQIFDILLDYLCIQHIEYAVDYGHMMIPTADPKSKPNIYFLDVVQQANTIFHLFEKQFSDTLLPLVNNSKKYSECNQKKKKVHERLDSQLDSGINKCLTSIIGWMKYNLKNEQKKSDFSSNQIDQQCTKACTSVGVRINLIKFSMVLFFVVV